MTLEEKVGQLVMVDFYEATTGDSIERGAAGSAIGFHDAASVASAQEKARRSRLGIPLLVGLDILHGFRTLFPMPLAEAASFDPALAARNAELAAGEAAPVGINWTFAPMVDIGRDPRWGRAVEGAGEDVLLSADFARARAEGFRRAGLAPTLKHFAAYGAVAGGRDYEAVSISDGELQSVHLPPFRAALGPATAIMPALTSLNGVPSVANPALLHGTLRGAWDFHGVVVSDWGAIDGLMMHAVATDGAEAARMAFKAGTDIDMASGLYSKHLADEIKAGRVTMDELDAAVRRVLTLKFELGLFEAPLPDPARAQSAELTPELRAAARAAVRESTVLLRNENDVLPLTAQAKRIAVIGPFADNAFDQLGPHEAAGRPEDTVTVLRGIAERAKQNGATVAYAQGCDALCANESGFAAAVEAARASDIVIAVLGERRELSGEAASRAFLDFWGKQDELLEALAATGKPIVLIVMAGRSLDLRRASQLASAILMPWFPGTEGGTGLADLLFGDHAPSAKLPVSWPRSVGQLPMHYDRMASGRPHGSNDRYTVRFIDEDASPLYPFGHGLTYTRFFYSPTTVSAAEIADADSVEVSATLTNAGPREGTEVAQLYVRDEVASRVQPLRRLKAYRRVTLKAGESRAVTFRLSRSDLAFLDEEGDSRIEPGRFRIGIGGDARAELSATFTLTR